MKKRRKRKMAKQNKTKKEITVWKNIFRQKKGLKTDKLENP